LAWPLGKAVGGSGNLDFLVYLKCNLGDFDNWARNMKDSSWKYDNLLPHFQRPEDIVSPTLLAIRESLMSTSKTLGTLDTKRRKDIVIIKVGVY
jgi:choline dehydrogenase-like flavoprotein